MTGAELRGSLIRIFGDKWPQKAVEKLKINRSTLTRQMNGTVPVSPQIQAHVETLLETVAKAERRRVKNLQSVRAYRNRKKADG